MNLLAKPAIVCNGLIVLLTICASLWILLDSLSAAAWGGLSVVVVFLLSSSLAATLALVVSMFFLGSPRPAFPIVAASGAGTNLALSVLFAGDFLFRRDPKIPLNSQVTDIFGRHWLHAPLLAIYGASILICALALTTSISKVHQLKISR